MTNLNNNELSARTNLHNFFHTVKAGLHNAVVSPRKRHALLVLLLLGAALCAAIYWPYHLPASLAGLMLVPVAFTYLCWAAVSAAAVGYVPGALEMDDKIFVYAVYKKYDRQIFGNRELPVFNINLSSKPRPTDGAWYAADF